MSEERTLANIAQTAYWDAVAQNGCVVTVGPDGTARQIECYKCHQCGYSVTIGKK